MQIKINLKEAFDEFYANINHSHTESSISYATTLNTTAQTLSQAINELQEEITNLQILVPDVNIINSNEGIMVIREQDYVVLTRIKENFSISCTINVDPASNGQIGLGIFEPLMLNSQAIDQAPGISIMLISNDNVLSLDASNFHDEREVLLDHDHEYRLTLSKQGDVYTGNVVDMETDDVYENSISSSNVDLEYVIVWGVGDLSFVYRDVVFKFLKTESQTFAGAINELYDNQEFLLLSITDKINEL